MGPSHVGVRQLEKKRQGTKREATVGPQPCCEAMMGHDGSQSRWCAAALLCGARGKCVNLRRARKSMKHFSEPCYPYSEKYHYRAAAKEGRAKPACRFGYVLGPGCV